MKSSRIWISIHAPREGGDQNRRYNFAQRRISIHAPREGGDTTNSTTVPVRPIFQSTPPARGATIIDQDPGSILYISIHAPREGGDYNTTKNGGKK